MSLKKEELRKIEEIYACGEITLEEMKKIKSLFLITCLFCKNTNISVMTENDDDGYCDSCSSPYARCTIKCTDCGRGISIRN